ncbi:hypothetical protein Tco_1504088 [Tanacetum coccineum]
MILNSLRLIECPVSKNSKQQGCYRLYNSLNCILKEDASSVNEENMAAGSSVSKSATKGVEKCESSPNAPLFLDQLEVDVTGTIIVMIGRIWDVNTVTGRYLSTDFVVSDSKVLLWMLPGYHQHVRT